MQWSSSSGKIIESGLKIDGFVKCTCVRLSIVNTSWYILFVKTDETLTIPYNDRPRNVPGNIERA